MCSHHSALKSSCRCCAGHGVCRKEFMIWICQAYKAEETGVLLAKWETSSWKSSWSGLFLIYESTWDKGLISQVAAEHAELMELRGVSGSIFLASESCSTLPCLRCCSLWGCVRLLCVCERFRGIGKEVKKKTNHLTVACPEAPMEIPKSNLSQSMKNCNRDVLTSTVWWQSQ